MITALIAVVAVLALALVAQTWMTGKQLRRMLDKFADQTERMIAQADERVKVALSESEKAYLAFHAAASPTTFSMFRSMSGGALVGAKYPTKQHYRKNDENPKQLPLLNGVGVNGVTKDDPVEALGRRNHNVATTLDVDELQNGGRV